MSDPVRSLIEQWRATSAEEYKLADACDRRNDGANSHACRGRGRIYRECADELSAALAAVPPQDDLREQIRSLEYKVLMQGRELENKQCIQCAGKLTEVGTKVTYRDGREEMHRQWRCAECDESDERTKAALEQAEAERDAALAKLAALAAVETPPSLDEELTAWQRWRAQGKGATVETPHLPGGFGYCGICYHPLDACRHCGANAVPARETPSAQQ